MKQIKEPKLVEIIINIKYELNEEELVQKFEFVASNKKHLMYLFDARFLFKNKIEKIISDNLLEGFKRRIDDTDNVIIIYEKQDKPKPYMRKVACYTPPYFGCNYCAFAKKEGLFVFCEKKDKHYTEGIKRCPIFRCKDEIIT